MNDKEYTQCQLNTLNRLGEIRQLTLSELHDQALMRNKLEEYDQ